MTKERIRRTLKQETQSFRLGEAAMSPTMTTNTPRTTTRRVRTTTTTMKTRLKTRRTCPT